MHVDGSGERATLVAEKLAPKNANCRHPRMTELSEVSSSNRKSIMVRIMRSLPKILAELPNWLKGVFDQSATADHNARLALHSNSQRALFVFHANECPIERGCGGKLASPLGGNRGRADPLQLACDRAVTLVGKCVEEQSYILPDGKPRQARFT
jgi:hypothetical protein